MHQTCFCLVTRSQSSDSHFFNSSGISTFTSLSGVGSRYTHTHTHIHIVVEDTVGAARTIELSATSCLPLFRRGVSVSRVTKDITIHLRHTLIFTIYILTSLGSFPLFWTSFTTCKTQHYHLLLMHVSQ